MSEQSTKDQWTEMMVGVIAEMRGIAKEQARVIYMQFCKEYRERQEKENQDRIAMEYESRNTS